jgi:hypothetical protein
MLVNMSSTPRSRQELLPTCPADPRVHHSTDKLPLAYALHSAAVLDPEVVGYSAASGRLVTAWFRVPPQRPPASQPRQEGADKDHERTDHRSGQRERQVCLLHRMPYSLRHTPGVRSRADDLHVLRRQMRRWHVMQLGRRAAVGRSTSAAHGRHLTMRQVAARRLAPAPPLGEPSDPAESALAGDRERPAGGALSTATGATGKVSRSLMAVASVTLAFQPVVRPAQLTLQALSGNVVHGQRVAYHAAEEQNGGKLRSSGRGQFDPRTDRAKDQPAPDFPESARRGDAARRAGGRRSEDHIRSRAAIATNRES